MADFEILIANEAVSDIFNDSEVQKNPIKIEGKKSIKYYILKIKTEVDCIDKKKSEFSVWVVYQISRFFI